LKLSSNIFILHVTTVSLQRVCNPFLEDPSNIFISRVTRLVAFGGFICKQNISKVMSDLWNLLLLADITTRNNVSDLWNRCEMFRALVQWYYVDWKSHY